MQGCSFMTLAGTLSMCKESTLHVVSTPNTDIVTLCTSLTSNKVQQLIIDKIKAATLLEKLTQRLCQWRTSTARRYEWLILCLQCLKDLKLNILNIKTGMCCYLVIMLHATWSLFIYSYAACGCLAVSFSGGTAVLLPCFQHAGTHFANLRTTDWVNPTWC